MAVNLRMSLSQPVRDIEYSADLTKLQMYNGTMLTGSGLRCTASHYGSARDELRLSLSLPYNDSRSLAGLEGM